MKLDADGEAALRFAAAAFKAERAAFRLVAARERTRRALSMKLRAKEHPEEVIRVVVDRLGDLGYVDDVRFAELWVRSRISKKPEGRVRLIAGLRARGVSGRDAEAAVARALSGGAEILLARQALQRIGGTPAERAKKLYAAGFSGASIRAALREND
jgi:regulatory protein